MLRIGVLIEIFPWSGETCFAGAAVSVDAVNFRRGKLVITGVMSAL
jgi:hypothetical protein